MAGTAESRIGNQEQKIALKEKFSRIIEENFHGNSEIAQKLIKWGNNKIKYREYKDKKFDWFDESSFIIEIPYKYSNMKTRLLFTPGKIEGKSVGWIELRIVAHTATDTTKYSGLRTLTWGDNPKEAVVFRGEYRRVVNTYFVAEDVIGFDQYQGRRLFVGRDGSTLDS